MSDELNKFRDLLQSTSRMAELDKLMGDVDPIAKLVESLHASAAIITFAEMAKAYGPDADKFIDKAVTLWESQINLTFQVLEVASVAVQDAEFAEAMNGLKVTMKSRQAAIADGFRKHVHEIMDGKQPTFNIPLVNFTSKKPPEC